MADESPRLHRPATRPASRALSAALLAAMALALWARLGGSHAVQVASWMAMAAVVATGAGRFGVRERYLLALCVLLTMTLRAGWPDAWDVLGRALDQAAFLLAFVLLLGLLQEAASTSPAIASVGRFLTGQPPGRRYAALCGGSGMLSVLFNIGTVAFLTPLVQRGVALATPGDPLNPVRERRQITALQRGFAWAVIWSPTAIAPLAVMELVPGVSRLDWSLLGFGVFLVVMAIGALEDGVRFRRLRPATRRAPPPTPWAAIGRLALACLWLFGMAAAVAALTRDTIVFGLMVACPLMLVGWLTVQHAPLRAPRASIAQTLTRLSLIAAQGLPQSSALAVTLAASGFIGVTAAALVPADSVTGLLERHAMPDFILLGLLPLVIAAMSLAALSPVVLAVFFGSLFGALPTLPADPTLLALSISCGWALSMTVSPFATVVLLMARVSGIPARMLTWRWNLVFSALAAAALFVVFGALTLVR